MSQTFERTVDRKDAIIRSLAMDIEEAEEQYQVALRKHLQNMDDLIGEGGIRIFDVLYVGALEISQWLFVHPSRVAKLL